MTSFLRPLATSFLAFAALTAAMAPHGLAASGVCRDTNLPFEVPQGLKAVLTAPADELTDAEKAELLRFAEIALKYRDHTLDMLDIPSDVVSQSELKMMYKAGKKSAELVTLEHAKFFLAGFIGAWHLGEVKEMDGVKTLDQFVSEFLTQTGFDFSEKQSNEISDNAGLPHKGACKKASDSASALERLKAINDCFGARI